MQEDSSSVSVIVPAFQAAAYVAAAIQSALEQSLPPLEVIVVDDGSTDGTRAAAAAFGERVRVLHQDHEGVGAARNRGAAAARGALLAFLDADDLWLPEKLARQVEHLRANPEVDLVCGHVVEFVSEDLDAAARARLLPHEGARPGVLASTTLIRRAAFERAGRFASDLRVAEFIDWYLRAREAGLRSAMLPDVVTRRRLHGANMGVRERHARADYARVLKDSLERRRAQAARAAAR